MLDEDTAGKAVELAAYWPCLRAYLESRANETARVVVVSTAGRADLPGADDAPVADVTYLADRPPPPCVSCVLFVFATSAAMACCLLFEGLMTQRPRETYYRRDQTRQRCARRRATPRSNAHVDAIARDLDVMASATAIFFSPASSMALLGAALAPEDVHLFEVCFAASFCPFSICCSRDLRRRPLARSLLRSRARGPPTREIPPRRHRRDLTSSRTHAGAEPREGLRGRGRRMPPAEEPQAGRRRVYGVVAVVASELTQVTTF